MFFCCTSNLTSTIWCCSEVVATLLNVLMEDLPDKSIVMIFVWKKDFFISNYYTVLAWIKQCVYSYRSMMCENHFIFNFIASKISFFLTLLPPYSHVTQVTTWQHPLSNVQHAISTSSVNNNRLARVTGSNKALGTASQRKQLPSVPPINILKQ